VLNVPDETMSNARGASNMEFDTIKFEEPENGIGLITLNRPDRLNAINLEMLEEFQALFRELTDHRPDVRVVILRGEGRGFCSGADLMDARMLEKSPELYRDAATFLEGVQKKYAQLIIDMRRLPQPIISVVQGAAAGGGFCMALATDVIIAGPKAKFVASFVNIGLSGGELGTTYFLPRLIGPARAAEILMTGRTVEAAEAERIGMISRLVDEDKLMDAAMDTARLMLGKSYLGLRQTKEAFRLNLNASSLEAAIELENRNQAICAFTPAFLEAVQAFTGIKIK
jgi:enoyl-CoA hydratase